ncbi:MAG: hypothetical protein OEY51_07245 [Cyclobacteriaceae bacterium]|nr:hypothetical protein [Cyclobacteriaceae bacterium]
MRIIRTIAFLLSVMFLSLHMLVQHEHHEKEQAVTHFHATENVPNLIHLLISVIHENLGASHLEEFVVDESVTGVDLQVETCRVTLPPRVVSSVCFIAIETHRLNSPASTTVSKRGPPAV